MKKDKPAYGLVMLIAVVTVAMIAVIPVDYEWTVFLRAHRIKALDHFMNRTLFEGEGLGGGDPVIILLFIALAGYYLAWNQEADIRLRTWRPQLGFILTGGLICSFIMVHSLKWVWGRARPAAVFKDRLPFTHWFEFGPQFVTDGIYSGSFPSGHTAQAFTLMTLAYVLTTAPGHKGTRYNVGIVWGAVSLAYVLTMGISRCMHASHWLSDIMASMGLGWIIIHLLYYRILNVPLQSAHFDRYGEHPDLPPVWELRLCIHIFGMTLGAMAVLLGIRGVFLGAPWPLYLLIPMGLVFDLFFWGRMTRLRQIVFNAYG